MKYHQRDIVEVSFLFPDGSFKPHPAIIVSNDELQEDEDGMFYLVLITSNDWLNPQIISGYIERDVIRKLGTIKEQYFNEIVDKIIWSIF